MLCWGAFVSTAAALLVGSLFSFSSLYLGFLSLYSPQAFFNLLGNPDDGRNGSFPVSCYFSLDAGWPDNGTLHPALRANMCTHVIFISSSVKNGSIAPSNPDDESKYFRKIPQMKAINPNVKVLLCNGGGGTVNFPSILGSVENRSRYINSSISYLRKFGFDGLDLDWEFPGWQPSPASQRPNFTKLVQEMRQAYNKEVLKSGQDPLLITAAVAAGRSVMVIYDVPALADALDYINLMCYDMHSYASYDPITGYNSPLYPKTWKDQPVFLAGNMGWSSNEWNRRGMPKQKILVGMPTYLHAWELLIPEYHGKDAPAKGKGKYDEQGYPDVCDFLAAGGTEVFDEDAYVPYAYHGNQWISYDNVKSLTGKAEWIINNKFGGIMIYSLNADDMYGHCKPGVKFPLVTAVIEVVRNRTRGH